MFQFTIHAEPISVNKLYRGFHRRFKTTDAVKFEKEVTKQKIGLEKPEWLKKETPVEVYYTFYYPTLWCKNGNIKRLDVMNYEKHFTDTIFENLDLDDKQIFKSQLEKKEGDYKVEVRMKLC